MDHGRTQRIRIIIGGVIIVLVATGIWYALRNKTGIQPHEEISQEEMLRRMTVPESTTIDPKTLKAALKELDERNKMYPL